MNEEQPRGYQGGYLVGSIFLGVVALRTILLYWDQPNLPFVLALLAIFTLLYVSEPWLSKRFPGLLRECAAPGGCHSRRRRTAYLEKCRVVLNLVEAAETDVAEDRAVARGNIRIGPPLSFGLKRLAPLLLEFAEGHPQVSLEMDYTDRRMDLVEEGFDLSIRITSRLGPGDVVHKLGSCKLVTVASPAYLARHGRPVRPADLAGHECLVYTGDPNPSTWTYGTGERAEAVYVRRRSGMGEAERI